MAVTTPTETVFSFFNEIGIINQLVSAQFSRALAPHLNISEFGVLNHFVRLGDAKTPSHLAKAFQVTKPSMTATLGKLERKGLVRISGSETDRRRKIVTLTDKGREARDRAVESIAPLAEIVITEQDVEQLRGMLPKLQALREFLDAQRNEVDGLS